MVVALADLDCDCGPCLPIVWEAEWYIDARTGSPDDIVGDVDAVPMTATLMVPSDGAVQFATMYTNEGNADPADDSLLSTPDSTAVSVTGDIDLRWTARSIDDASNAGVVPHPIYLAKFVGGSPNVFDYAAKVLLNGTPEFSGSGLNEQVGSPGDVDIYATGTHRFTRDATSGEISFYDQDDSGSVVTADGTHWRLVASVAAAAGPLDDTSGTYPVAMIAKGVGAWFQIYDGIDGTLVAEADIDRDAPAGLAAGGSFASATTGETWTLGAHCATFGIDRNAWLVGNTGQNADGPFTVPDAPSINIGTGDFTVVALLQPSTLASGGADFRSYLLKVNPATIGSNGVGWGLFDYSPLGGLLFGLNDGTGLHFVHSAWTGFDWHLIVVTGDRSGNLSLYLDDMVTPASTTSIAAATGTLSNALDLAVNPTEPSLLESALIFSVALDGTQRTHLSELLLSP